MPTPAILHSQPANPNWREAASLIILAPGTDHHPPQSSLSSFTSSSPAASAFDYSILMVKRSGGSSFMASAFVFPGGQVELSDFDHRWYGLFSRHLGLSEETVNSSVSDEIVGPRPPIVRQSITLRKHTAGTPVLNPDIALRIAAIRETFEEAGKHFSSNFTGQNFNQIPLQAFFCSPQADNLKTAATAD